MTSTDAISRFYAVVPAGGPGTRLWPLSRTERPKFLLDLTGTGRSLIQQTWDRIEPLATPERVVVVTGRSHSAALNAQLPRLAQHNLLCEPSSRDTTAAIGLAAAIIARRDPSAIIGAFPADHIVRDAGEFHEAVRRAVAAAREGYIAIMGINPTGPSTAFGYIQTGEEVPVSEASGLLRVVRFVEKPDEPDATRYLEQGNWLWNAGTYIARADVLLKALEDNRPALHSGIQEIADSWNTARHDEVVSSVWPSLEKIAIDYAVSEPLAPSGRVVVVPATLGWDDIGDWAAVAAILSPSGNMAPAVLGDVARVFADDSTGLVVAEGGRTVRVHGLQDIVVVDTPDILLVMPRDRAQEVKLLVEELRRRGQLDLV